MPNIWEAREGLAYFDAYRAGLLSVKKLIIQFGQLALTKSRCGPALSR
ncbi:MAG: hypothetical protein JNL09_10795 [Anaerolineales bacterium]|nr:hypothetical protein [Anaerolineales bacterium]